MYVFALLGSAILLIGAFPHYTSRPDLFPGIDSLASFGALASIAAGTAAVLISWHALRTNHVHALVALGIPAGFTAFQLLASLRLMSSVAAATEERVRPGPGLVLSVTGAALIGYIAYRAAHMA